MKHPSCTLAGCHRRAAVMVEERTAPWKWERRWRCADHADAGEVRPLAVKSPAILAIEAAGREPVAVAAAPVVEVAPPVVADPVPVARAVEAPKPATVREPKAPKAR